MNVAGHIFSFYVVVQILKATIEGKSVVLIPSNVIFNVCIDKEDPKRETALVTAQIYELMFAAEDGTVSAIFG